MRWLLAPFRAVELVFLWLVLAVLSVIGLFTRKHRPKRPRRWTARRVIRVIAGALLVAVGLAALPAGAVGLWLDRTGRDAAGFIGTDLRRFSSPGHAITTEPGALRFDGPAWLVNQVLGTVRVTAVSASAAPLFLGVATTRDATTYLAPVEHTVIHRLDQNSPEPVSDERAGQAPVAPPGAERMWVAKAAGAGIQAVEWQARAGNWSVVVMKADGGRGVEADLSVAASLPWLDEAGVVLLGAGGLALLIGTLMIMLTTRAARRRPLAPVPG